MTSPTANNVTEATPNRSAKFVRLLQRLFELGCVGIGGCVDMQGYLRRAYTNSLENVT